MTINRIIFILIATTFIFSSCKKSNQFTINGKITHAEGKKITLEKLFVSSIKPVGETTIDKHGEFEFKGETGIPAYYLLKLDDKIITLLIDSLEHVVVEADAANLSREYNVEGSPGSVLVKELVMKLNVTEHKLDSLESLNKLYLGNPDYETLKQKWSEEYNKIVQEQTDFSTNFVMQNPFSMASIYALYQQYRKDGSYVVRDLQTMRTAASALNSIYPQSDHVKALYQNTVQLLKNEKSAKMHQFIQENGANSPDIVLPDQNGKEIALSSLRGKYVLVHFWAAADRGSRILNPVLVEAYKKYKRKGFEIYQVSIDNNRIEWVDAIDKDKLSWINVGDMKGSVHATNVYNVKQIPFNYLLDKEGVIIARNLQGPTLNKTLSQILK
jgi:peroxiredoxin